MSGIVIPVVVNDTAFRVSMRALLETFERAEAALLRAWMLTALRDKSLSPTLRHALETTAAELAALARDPNADHAPAHNPLATRCGGPPGCDTVFDAPADVKVGDVLTCPTCGARSRVIDTGQGAVVEYIRARGD